MFMYIRMQRMESKVECASLNLFTNENITCIDIAQINAERLQRCENPSNLWPSFTEDFRFFFLPLSKNVLTEVRRFIQISARKVEKKWWADNRHLYRAKLLINAQQLRHIEAENSRSFLFTKTLIDTTLLVKRALFTVKLYREKSWFGLVFGSEDRP
jgi:hypothetical protein